MKTKSIDSFAEQDLIVRRIERFLSYEAYLLDHFAFDEWLDLYTDDAKYWVPLEAGQADPVHTHSIIYDDKHLMKIRVRQLAHPRAHARLPLTRTVHQVGNVLIQSPQTAGVIDVHSTLVMFEYRKERQRMFAANVSHRLIMQNEDLDTENQEFRISSKRVDLINSEAELDGIAFFF